MNVRTIKFLALSLFIATVTGCSDGSEEPAPAIKTGKAIQSFSLNINFPQLRAVPGVIDEATKKITVNLGIDDDVKGISATAVLSAGASISPSLLTPANYEQPVVFTVRAEDTSETTYTVEIKRAKMSVTSVNKQALQPGEVLTFNGSNLLSFNYYLGANITADGKEVQLQHEGNTSYNDKGSFKIREDQEIGSYELKIKLGKYDSVIWPTPIVIDFPNHNTTITNVTTEKRLMAGDPPLYRFTTFIQGRFLGNLSHSETGSSKVYLVKKSDESIKQELTINAYGGSEKLTYFSINAYVPNGTISVGDYYLEIVFKGQTYRYGQVLSYPW